MLEELIYFDLPALRGAEGEAHRAAERVAPKAGGRETPARREVLPRVGALGVGFAHD